MKRTTIAQGESMVTNDATAMVPSEHSKYVAVTPAKWANPGGPAPSDAESSPTKASPATPAPAKWATSDAESSPTKASPGKAAAAGILCNDGKHRSIVYGSTLSAALEAAAAAPEEPVIGNDDMLTEALVAADPEEPVNPWEWSSPSDPFDLCDLD